MWNVRGTNGTVLPNYLSISGLAAMYQCFLIGDCWVGPVCPQGGSSLRADQARPGSGDVSNFVDPCWGGVEQLPFH